MVSVTAITAVSHEGEQKKKRFGFLFSFFYVIFPTSVVLKLTVIAIRANDKLFCLIYICHKNKLLLSARVG